MSHKQLPIHLLLQVYPLESHLSGTACLVLEFVAGGQICQRKLLSAVSDSSQQVVIIKLTVVRMHSNALQCSALHCFALRTGAGTASTHTTWI